MTISRERQVSGISMTEYSKKVPVSVVVPCYCCHNTIERAISSVMFQTMHPEEIFLIDDASPDNGLTLQKLYDLKRRYGHITKIGIIQFNINRGPSAARNAGWDSATQPYIAFLDADDSWHPQKLEIQYKFISQDNNISLIGCKSIVVDKEYKDENLSQSVRDIDLRLHEIKRFELLISNRFSTPSVVIKKDIPFRFVDGKRQSEDYLLWLRIVFNGFKAVRVEYPLVYLHKPPFGDAGLSLHLIEHEKGELDTYRSLYSDGLLNLPSFVIISIYSIMKFFRRCMITFLRRLRGVFR